ncbi:uncharacterized protein LOC143275519 [Babylonia areolata]|uniref:uncharacterized protein LOC143275519 n=1 Tax=Babylonia areolata TaxID=304850 RepID=UPI003FCF17C4
MTSGLRAISSSRPLALQGRTPFALPNSGGNICFQLTTHISGRSSLRHFLSGLHEIESHYREAELVQINQVDVRTWSHVRVTAHLNQQLDVLSERDLTMTVRARDSEGRKHIVEVTVNAIFEDGIGDSVRAAYDIIVRLTDKIVTTPDVTDVQFEGTCYVRVRHGAQTGFFLKVGSDHILCMDVPPSEKNDYVFKCYNFIGHNHVTGGGGGEGEEEEEGGYPRLCVLQQPRSGRFVAACPISGCLKTDEEKGFHTDIQSITKPDCHFFIVHASGNAGETFCIRPLVMRNYYLRYDAVRGLKLAKCKTPPYKDFAIIRYFSFEFVPATLASD